MKIESDDLDFKIVNSIFGEFSEDYAAWKELEDLYNNVIPHTLTKKNEKINRSLTSTPIARDTVLIKRSIFTTSFLVGDFILAINKVGEDDDEAARQLRIACEHYWNLCDPYVEINKAMLRMLILPIGITTVYWDAKKDRPVIEEKNPTDIAFDRGARNHNTVEYLAYKYEKSAKEIAKIIYADASKKKADRFYNMLDDHLEFFGTPYDEKTFQRFVRYELKEIYVRENGFWLCKTYYKNILMRVVKFSYCPFQWGFTRERLSSVDENRRKKECAVYGESEIALIKEHVRAINMRRNQHNDLIEEAINPSTYVGTGAKVNPSYLKRGAGSSIPVGDVNQIRERRVPPTLPLHDDLEILKHDIETTTSISGNQKNVTSTSDRRSLGAIALLNSQSTTRVEDQITTANKTLFSHLAKSFVYLVWKHASSDTLHKLGIVEPLIGRDAVNTDDEFDFTVTVNFGSDTKRAEEFSAIMEMIQAAGQFQNVNPATLDKMFVRAASIKLGDKSDLATDLIQEAPAEMPVNEAPPPTYNGGI